MADCYYHGYSGGPGGECYRCEEKNGELAGHREAMAENAKHMTNIPPYPKLTPSHVYGDYEGVEQDLAKLEQHRGVVPSDDTETHAKLDFQIERLRTVARVYRDFA